MRPLPISADIEERVEEVAKSHTARTFVVLLLMAFLNLAAIYLTFAAIGGLGDWTGWEFIALFGLVECAAGLASIVLANVWKLPVDQQQSKKPLTVTPAGLFKPHWAALGRALGGAVMMAAAGRHGGLEWGSWTVAPALAFLAVSFVASSMLVARAGVARPDLDVVQIIIRRSPGDIVVPPESIGAALMQMLLTVVAIPIVKGVEPATFYASGIGVEWPVVGVMAAVAAILACGSALAWRDRFRIGP